MDRNRWGLSAKQERYAQEYIIDLDKKKAAVRAGYTRHNRYLIEPVVLKRIEFLLEERSKQTKITAESVLAEIYKIATVDIRKAFTHDNKPIPISQLPAEVAAAVQAFDVYKDFTEGVEVGETQKLKFADRLRALELLGKHLELFTDKVKITGTLGLADRLNKARTRK